MATYLTSHAYELMEQKLDLLEGRLDLIAKRNEIMCAILDKFESGEISASLAIAQMNFLIPDENGDVPYLFTEVL